MNKNCNIFLSVKAVNKENISISLSTSKNNANKVSMSEITKVREKCLSCLSWGRSTLRDCTVKLSQCGATGGCRTVNRCFGLCTFSTFFYYAVVLFSLLKKYKRQPKVQCCESQSLQADKNLIKFLIYGLEERRKGRNLLYSWCLSSSPACSFFISAVLTEQLTGTHKWSSYNGGKIRPIHVNKINCGLSRSQSAGLQSLVGNFKEKEP